MTKTIATYHIRVTAGDINDYLPEMLAGGFRTPIWSALKAAGFEGDLEDPETIIVAEPGRPGYARGVDAPAVVTAFYDHFFDHNGLLKPGVHASYKPFEFDLVFTDTQDVFKS